MDGVTHKNSSCRRQHFQKHFVLIFCEPHLLEVPNFPASTFVPGPSPRHDATLSAGSQHETDNALGLKATSRLMTLLKHLHASCTPNVIMHYDTHSENCANCVNCGTTNLLRDSFRSPPAGLRQPRIVCSSQTELLLAFHTSCITPPRSSTFPDYLRDSVPVDHLTL